MGKANAKNRGPTALPRGRKRGAGGNPGYAGYEYQIEVTIWIALDLMLAKAATDTLNIEPPSHEDIEASIQKPADALLGLMAQVDDRMDLIFQVKTRSSSPWSSKDFARILTGTANKKDNDGGQRSRPLEMLKADTRRRYVFITNEALSHSLRVHRGEEILDFPEVSDLPPYARQGLDAATQSELAPRILLCAGVTEEVLRSRIERLLSRHGHVPSVNQAACLRDLREAVRNRIRGQNGGRWSRAELVSVLTHHGGSVAPTRAMDHYVPPRSFDHILRKLDSSHAVIIAGPSGTGKTLTADILEARLRKADPPFEVVGEEHGPGPIRQRLIQSGAVLFHLRDPWGGNRLTPEAERWTGELPKLLSSAGPERKFVVTSRSDVLQSAGAELTKELTPYMVPIEIDDYGSERIGRIYDGIAGDVTGHARSLARDYREAALKALHRPYEVDRFLVALTREDALKPRKVEEIISDSQIDAISGVIAKQIVPLGAEGVAGAAVIWALLIARGAVLRDVFASLLRRIRVIDSTVRPDVDGMIDFLVAGRNLRQDGRSLSLYHPKVEEGLRMAFMRQRVEAEHVLSLVVDGLAALDAQSDDWGIESGLAALREAAKLDGIELSLASTTQAQLDDHLEKKATDADRRYDFERALADLARFGSDAHVPSRLAQALIDGGPETEETAFMERWRPPALSESDVAELKDDARTAILVERFVREVLPFARTNYDPAVAALLLQLVPGIAPAFWDALETVAGPGGPNENIEAIVAGACAGDSPDFDRAITRFAQSEAEADAWMEKEYAEQGRQAEEHEVDAVAADHILEEPQERYYNAQCGMKEIVKLRRRRGGLSWIVGHPHRQSLISAASELIGQSRRRPDSGDLRLLLQHAEGWTRAAAWHAVQQHWSGDFADLLEAELAKENLGSGLRGTLIEIAAQSSQPSGDPVSLLAKIIPRVTTERQLELVYDVIRTSLDSDGRGEAGKVARRARAQRVCDILGAPVYECGRLLVALLSEEEITAATRNMSESATNLLASLLPTLSNDVAGPLVCAAAAIGIDIDAAAERLLAEGDADDGTAAVHALVISRKPNAQTVLRKAFGHERYPVRRAALEAVMQLGAPQDRDRILGAANDRSADVRLAWARLMQEYRWPEAIDALVKLLSDERDFSSDPGYLRGSSWSEFRVARAAARALGAYEQLPEDAVTALLDAIQAETRDPFVACAAIAALADKDDDRISDAINVALESSGMKCAPEHRPLAQAAAWSAFDRAVANKPMQLSSTAIGMANEDSPVVAGPLLMAAGVLGGETQKVLARRLEGPKFAARAALMKVCAVVAEPERDTEFTGLESILAELASGTEWKDLSKKRQAEVQGWSDSLDPSNDVERFTAWVLDSVLGVPVPREVGDPRAFHLPQRIGVMTMRSLSPAREEGPRQDDGF